MIRELNSTAAFSCSQRKRNTMSIFPPFSLPSNPSYASDSAVQFPINGCTPFKASCAGCGFGASAMAVSTKTRLSIVRMITAMFFVFIFSVEQTRNYRRIRTSARWQTLTAILLCTPCFWFSALPESLEIGAVFPNSHQTKKKTDPKKWPEAAHVFTWPDGGSYRQGHSSSDGCQRDIARNDEG